MMILVWVIVGFGLYYFMKNTNGNNTGNESSNNHSGCCSTNKNKKSPEEILKERFVNGEIDEETYLKMKDTLNK